VFILHLMGPDLIFILSLQHPIAVFFHLLFKCSALFLYIFGSWFTSSYILVFVMCTILLAFDFWTVKNVSGRLLVGLRWWSYVREDGTNEWVFEALEDMSEIGPTDSRVFWYTIYGTPIAWSLLLVIGVLRLKFEYIPVILVALFLNGANCLGYYKCSASAQERIRNMMKTGGTFSFLENSAVKNWVVNSLFSVSGIGGNSAAAAAPTGATATV
jgi:hypothetical protein